MAPLYDLRHTFITELAETSRPDLVIDSVAGHPSRRMLAHYSHIRLAAKRKALEVFDGQRAKERQQSQRGAEAAVNKPSRFIGALRVR